MSENSELRRGWPKWAGAEPIDADTFLRRAVEEDAYHAGMGQGRITRTGGNRAMTKAPPYYINFTFKHQQCGSTVTVVNAQERPHVCLSDTQEQNHE